MAVYNAPSASAGRMPRAPVRRLGGWKLAYADFLTALCALFLVMWLVNGATPGARKDVAEQFGGAGAVQTVPENKPAPAGKMAAGLRQTALFSVQTANVSLQQDDDTLRIDLIDLDRSPLFETGRKELNARGNELIALAAQVIITLDRPVSIEGHTDSRPIRRPGYSNWELSADRANATRRALNSNGVPNRLIAGVTGLADTRPITNENPSLPQNRRLSIVVHLDAD